MTTAPTRRDSSSKFGVRATARAAARPGTAIAASAPVVLVVLGLLPGQRPSALLPCVTAVVVAGALVMAAELATLSPGRTTTPLAVPPAPPTSWSDPATIGVQRWLAHWPGVAGISAVSWWAARVGVAGLLSRLAFSAVGLSSAPALAAAAAAALALAFLLPYGRHVVHGALGVVAIGGLTVTVGGLLAATQGHLTTALAPGGALVPTAASATAMVAQSCVTIALVGLAATCALAVAPATSTGAGRKTTWAIWLGVGTAIGTWGLAVPAILRAAGLDLPFLLADGNGSALRHALAVALGPLAGSHAVGLAGGLVLAAGLAGAAGALAGGTALADNALAAAGRRRGQGQGWPGPTSRGAARASTAPGSRQSSVEATGPARRRPALATIATTGAAALAAAASALAGPQAWLVICLGALAIGALALTTLAPPVLGHGRRVPPAVRVAVACLSLLVVTIALGAAGPAALALAVVVALSGAFILGRTGHSPGPSLSLTKPALGALPWSTIAAAVLSTGAVATFELLPNGVGGDSSDLCKALAVVVMGAGLVALAVFPGTSRHRAHQLTEVTANLAGRSLPALVCALGVLAEGEVPRSFAAELSDLGALTAPLEAELAAYGAADELLPLTQALVQTAHQVMRIAAAVDAVAQLDNERLEELVEERTAVLSSANRTLVDSQWRRRQLLDRTVRAAEGERARIAANLHDGPIQRLAAMGLIMDRCRLRMDRDDRAGARDLVKRARTELSEEIHNLRRMMSELRPPVLDEGGLDAALQDHVSAWSAATGIEGRFESSGCARLSANSEIVIYRVVQESLANVAKHARATLTTVTLTPSGSGIQAVVRDNGKGFGESSQPDLLRNGHFGLVLMRERVELAAGRFEVISAPRTGTEILIWLPVLSTRKPVEAA